MDFQCADLRELMVFLRVMVDGDATSQSLSVMCQAWHEKLDAPGVMLRLMEGAKGRHYDGSKLLQWSDSLVHACSLDNPKRVPLRPIELSLKGATMAYSIREATGLTSHDFNKFISLLVQAINLGFNSNQQLSLFLRCASNDGGYLSQCVECSSSSAEYRAIRSTLQRLMLGERARNRPGLEVLSVGLASNPDLPRQKSLHLTEKGRVFFDQCKQLCLVG